MDILEPVECYKIYVLRTCPYSIKALKMLKDKNKMRKIIYVGEDMPYDKFKSTYGQDATFPRVFKNGKLIGGSETLELELDYHNI